MAGDERASEEISRKSDEAGRYPGALADREDERVRWRRREGGSAPDEEIDCPPRGVGLSGGGIRSATFCLGVFQAMARVGLARRFDFLSTVSGGGYFGSFFAALFTRAGVSSAADAEEVLLGDRQPDALRNLRENGRYLAPNGSGDLLLAGAELLRNWVALQIVLLSLVIAACLVLQCLTFATPLGKWTPFAGAATGVLWWSPWLGVASVLFAVIAVPAGWAYWMAGRQGRIHPAYGLAATAGVGLWLAAGGAPLFSAEAVGTAGRGVLVVVLLTALAWALAFLRSREAEHDPAQDDERGNDERNRLSTWLKWALIAVAVLLGVTVVDTLARTLYLRASGLPGISGTIAALLLGLSGLAQKLSVASRLRKSEGNGRVRLPASLLAGAGALLVALLIGVLADCLALGFAWGFGAPRGVPAALLASEPTRVEAPLLESSGSQGSARVTIALTAPAEGIVVRSTSRDSAPPWLPAGIVAVFCWLFGHVYSFLNRSSHHALYSARLTRAYLGASNPARAPGRSISRVIRGDEPGVGAYWSDDGARRGAPLHLINVTVNETVSGRSQVEQRDRKGVAMALGPCGVSLGKGHHLLLDWGRPDAQPSQLEEGRWPVFRGPNRRLERLSVGQWVGVSGAAFTTGLGYRTSLGLSFLLGFANVRLGYWWKPDNRVSPDRGRASRLLRWLLPVQGSLFDELLARFPGTAEARWYLSDGGHFENLGGYELVRRRIPRIVLIDAECDPDYELGGLANLVRKARIDFNCEIRFWDERRLGLEMRDLPPGERPPVGTLEELKRKKRSKDSSCCAAIADVLYDFDDEQQMSQGRLLYVKAALCGGEPVDVREYHARHGEFPHETTADQFFDEAQWESYRKLGEHIGGSLFGTRRPGPQPAGPEWLTRQFFD